MTGEEPRGSAEPKGIAGKQRTNDQTKADATGPNHQPGDEPNDETTGSEDEGVEVSAQSADGNDGTGASEATGAESAAEEPASEFATLKGEVEEISLEKLVSDPDYREFVKSFGEFSMPDDNVTLDELVDGVPPDVAASGPSADPNATSSDAQRSRAVDWIIAALDDDTVTEGQRAALCEALGIQSHNRIEVQLNYLKSRFLDLEAYIQAMEEFFDRNQTPLDELEEHRTAIEAFRDEIRSLDVQLESLRDDLERVDGRQEMAGERLAEHERALERTRSTLQQNFELIETELEAGRRWRQRVGEATRTDGGEDREFGPLEGDEP